MVDRVEVPAEEGISNVPKPADNTENKDGGKILGKFDTQADLEKAYKELEAKFTKDRQSETKESPESKPTATGKPDAKTEMFDKPNDEQKSEQENKDDKSEDGDKPATLEDVKSILPGFTEEQIMEFSNHAWENGALSDDQYAALEKQGYSREIVDQYIQGQFALVEKQRDSLINAGGGEDAVTAMFDWAAKNLPADEVERYNSKFDAGGADALMAMEHLKSRFAESGEGFGFHGKGRVGGANANGEDTSVYTSTAQVTKDMQSQEYKTDPAFRAKVAAKIGRSKVL